MKKLHCYFFTDDELHAEYAWAWVLHSLVPRVWRSVPAFSYRAISST